MELRLRDRLDLLDFLELFLGLDDERDLYLERGGLLRRLRERVLDWRDREVRLWRDRERDLRSPRRSPPFCRDRDRLAGDLDRLSGERDLLSRDLDRRPPPPRDLD